MRNSFIKALLEMAGTDPSIYLLTGDLGYSVIEPFQQRFPQRYLNAGISEQNMITVAAGLAMAGKQVFVYSIIPFATMRCFEQVRLDLCYHNLPVRIVGVGAGFSYGTAAGSHHALEDIAIMRCLPHMTVVAPGSKFETEQLTKQLSKLTGPAYLRLGNNEELVTYTPETKVTLGKALEVIPSDQYLLITTSNALDLGFTICTLLREKGLDIGLISMHTIKPLDTIFLLNKESTLKGLFTLEEHSVIGGLGSAVAELVAEQFEKKIMFKSFGVRDTYFHVAGSRSYLQNLAGLTKEIISTEIERRIYENSIHNHHHNKQSITAHRLPNHSNTTP